jgi:peptide-methionine (S)-S-oxide reductase
VNRQGPDFGDQYRTVIFYMDAEQEAAAKASKQRVQERTRQPIATSIEPTTGFWRAEEYHQCYLDKRGQQGGLAGMMRSVLGS